MVLYGGNTYRHKVGITTNVSPIQIGLGTVGDAARFGSSTWDLLVKASILLVISLQHSHTTQVTLLDMDLTPMSRLVIPS